MDILIYLLCIIFSILIINHIISIMQHPIIEGMSSDVTYDEYSDDPLILAQKNAGNIDYLKSKLSKIDELTKTVADLSVSVQTNTDAVTAITDAQTEQTEQLQSAQDEITG